jgi:uncharacterized protein (TIGR03546 family)
MIWFSFISRLFSILHSDKDPRTLAAGFALGAVVGLTPLFSLHNLFIVCLILILNVSISGAFFGFLVFSAFSFIFDPQFHDLGYWILAKLELLRPLWTQLYNSPFTPLTRFNNTVVMGSLVVGLLLLIPIYFSFKKSVNLYQVHAADKVNRLKVVQIIRGSSLIQWYNRIRLR